MNRGTVQLGVADLVVFILYMIVAVGLGFLVAVGRRKTTKGYFLGGKSLPWFVVAASMVASDVSSEHFIANSGGAFKYGIVLAAGSWNTWIIYSLLIWIFLPYYVRTGLYTVPEFLERRYNAACRYIFSASLVVGYVAAIIAGALYAGGLALESMLGPFIDRFINTTEHQQVVAGIIFFAALTGAYTIYGGLRSAAWTDFMQIIVLGIGGVLVPILGLIKVGGPVKLVHDVPDKFRLFLPVSHPVFPATGVFSGFLTVGIWYSCTSQHMVQRVLAAKDEWNARMGVVGAGFLHIVTPLFFVLPGIIAFRLMPTLNPPDAAYLSLVRLLVPTGLRGLILAGMAAALMSNLSSVLNSSSTLVTMDFYKKLFRPDSTDEQQVHFGQLAGAVILLIGLVVAWYYSAHPDMPLFVRIQNVFFYIAPPFAVIFTLGLLWRRANETGALATIFTGFAFTAALDHVYPQMAYLHRALFAWCFCMATMAGVSLATAPPTEAQTAGIIWNRRYAALPEELGRRYHGWRDFRIWWLLFVGIVLTIYGTFAWLQWTH